MVEYKCPATLLYASCVALAAPCGFCYAVVCHNTVCSILGVRVLCVGEQFALLSTVQRTVLFYCVPLSILGSGFSYVDNVKLGRMEQGDILVEWQRMLVVNTKQ